MLCMVLPVLIVHAFRFFIDKKQLVGGQQSWKKFCRLAFPKFSDWSSFDLDMALDAIRLAVNDSTAFIFLVADELAEALDPLATPSQRQAELSLYLTDIGNSLDNDRYARFDALVTQVDQVLFAECTLKSHRYFDWIQLTG